MKQGAGRHAHAVRGADFYETPECATLALLRVEALPKRIWEPAAGRGAISRVLMAHGHAVFAQDLNAHRGRDRHVIPRLDFLEEVEAPPGCECIVTNPPYRMGDAFIRHGLELVPTVIVLLRLMAIEGAQRADLVDRHLLRVWAGIERLPMLHRDGWQGRKIRWAGMPFGWFVFTRDGRKPRRPIELRRVSWREGGA